MQTNSSASEEPKQPKQRDTGFFFNGQRVVHRQKSSLSLTELGYMMLADSEESDIDIHLVHPEHRNHNGGASERSAAFRQIDQCISRTFLPIFRVDNVVARAD